MIKITKNKFQQYEGIRKIGITNMFDVKKVCQLSRNLKREEVLEIMKDYNRYKNQFNNKYEGFVAYDKDTDTYLLE